MAEIPNTVPGIARFDSDTFEQYEFFLSDTPTMFTEDMEVAASQNLAYRQVVGVDGAGRIIPAVLGTTAAIGITTAPIVTGVGENPTLQIYRGGHYNGDALVWDATYDDDAKKIAAFRAAPSPTQILIAFNKFNRKP